MLIVHASSSCDICLDAYDWDTPTQMPHAIPCGHIFCKTCLTSMGSTCPFCRNRFVASRIVKLHVDRPAASELGVEDVELLQRLGAEEAKRQVELEAAVEQSKQRERALLESLERARCLRRQREEEAEARKQREEEAEARKQREKEAEARKQRKKEAKARKRREKEAKARKQQQLAVAGKSASADAEPSTRETPAFFCESTITHTIGAAAPSSTRWGWGEGGGWRGEGGSWSALRRNTLADDGDLTGSDASHTFFTFDGLRDGAGYY